MPMMAKAITTMITNATANQHHSSTKSITERVKLFDDLNVTLRFITKL